MNSPSEGSSKQSDPSFVGILSSYIACSSSNTEIPELNTIVGRDLTSQMKSRVLREQIFFHHFLALEYIRYAFNDTDRGRAFTDQFIKSIKDAEYLSELKPLPHFSIEVQHREIQEAIFGFASIPAVMAQELYLQRSPSDSERAIMEMPLFHSQANSASGPTSHLQYYSLALMARYCAALSIELKTFEHLQLYLHTSAISQSAGNLYRDAFQLTDTTSASEVKPPQTKPAKEGWLSRLFK